jgi:hypothetical protein
MKRAIAEEKKRRQKEEEIEEEDIEEEDGESDEEVDEEALNDFRQTPKAVDNYKMAAEIANSKLIPSQDK